jgi:hypothetical protein
VSIYSSFKTDPNLETEGVEIIYNFKPEYQNDDKTWPTFTVKRAGGRNAKEYDLARERARRPFKDKIAKNTMEDEDNLEILINAFLDAVLVTWKNFQDNQGQNVEYTVEHARKLFFDLPEFFYDLHQRVISRDLFLSSGEADLKN